MVLQRSSRMRLVVGVVFCAASVCASMAQFQSSRRVCSYNRAVTCGFCNPPPEARLRCYWWWLNGNTDAATITHDLEEMKAKGFRGALLVDANGPNQDGNAKVAVGPMFGSKEWVALYVHALREAERLGLEITLNITSGWNLGGPGVSPEQASKLLTWTQTQVKGGAPVVLKLPTPPIKNGFYQQVAMLAYPLAHGPGLALQPGSLPAEKGANEASAEKRSALILRLRSAGASNGESVSTWRIRRICWTTCCPATLRVRPSIRTPARRPYRTSVSRLELMVH